MIHFLGEILLLILFTALLWFGIGWWVSSIERNKTLRAREEEWRHYLNTLRRDRDAFRDEVEKAHGQIRVLENRRADGQSPPKDSEMETPQREQYEQVIRDQQEKFETTERKMLGFSQHIETLLDQNLERENTLTQLRKKITELTEMLHQREELLANFNTGAAAQVNETHSQLQDLQERTLTQEHTITQLRDAATANETAAEHAAALEHALTEKSREVEQLQHSIEQSASNTGTESPQQIMDLKNLVREQEFAISQLRDQIANSKPAPLEEEMQDMREVMTEQEEIIGQLRMVLDKATRQTRRPGKPRARAPAATPADAPRSGDLFADAPKKEALQHSQPGTSTSGGQPPGAGVMLPPSHEEQPDLGKPAQDQNPASAGTDKTGPQTTVSIELLGQAPDKVDDLKVINGIGPAFEKTLNHLGIYHFAQIAALSRDDIDWIAQELNSFPERIVRDRWVGQAKKLETGSAD